MNGNDFYLGNSTANLSQLALKTDIPSVTQYVHPAEKQCNYTYTHPKAKQCNYSVSIINNLTSSSTTAALSANQGRLLNQKIAELETKIEESAAPTVVGTGTGNFRFNSYLGDVTSTTTTACDYIEIILQETVQGAVGSGTCSAGGTLRLAIDRRYNSSTNTHSYDFGVFSLNANGTKLTLTPENSDFDGEVGTNWVAYG